MANPNCITVSIVIPVHNGGEKFRRCLLSIQQATQPSMEVIVVADGESDSSWHCAKEFGATVLKLAQTGGPARARNIGAQAAQGDIVFFVDADVEIHPDTVERVVAAFRQDPDLVALIGSYDDRPGETNFLSQYKNLLHHYVHQTACEEASTFWGACGAIRRQQFLAVGGFDERYRYPSVEDIELGYRLKARGYRIRLCKDLQVKHLKHWGPFSLLRADFCYRALPWTALILRDRQMINDLNLGWSSRFSVLLVYGILSTLGAALWWLPALTLTVIFLLLLLILNIAVYRFFYRRHGFVFAVQAIPWHWFYYGYSGFAFALGLVRYGFIRSKHTKRCAAQMANQGFYKL